METKDGTTEQPGAATEVSQDGNGVDSTSTSNSDGLSEQATKDASTKTSEDQKPGDKSADQTKPDEWTPPKTKAEYDLAIEKATNSKAQALKDKESVPLQSKLSELTKKNKELEKALTRKTDDALLNVLEKDTQDGTLDDDAPRIKDFTKLKTLIGRIRTLEDSEEALKSKTEGVDTIERTQQAREMALNHLLAGQDEDVKKQVDSLVKELMECRTPREMELTLLVKGQKSSTTKEPPKEKKPGLTRTDSGRHTAPGGADIDTLSPREKIEAGIELAKKNK